MPDSIRDRRAFLQHCLVVTCVCTSGSLVLPGALAQEPIVIAVSAKHSANGETLTRVKSVLEVRGEVRLKSNREATESVRKAEMESKTTLQYEERFSHESTGSRAALYFQVAEAKNTVEKHATDSKLREESQTIIRWGNANDTKSLTAGVDQPLTESERNLVDSPVVSMFLDCLVPESNSPVGQKTKLDTQAVANLLNLDAIQNGTLTVTVVESNENDMQLEINGDLSASVDGVPTRMTFVGKATASRAKSIITYLAATITEEREIGYAKPGFNVTARLRLIRESIDESSHLKPLADYADAFSTRQERRLQLFESNEGGYKFFADANWIIYKNSEIDSVLRMVKNNRSLGQCNVVNLADMEPGKQLTLEGFRTDVKRTSGNARVQILEEAERLTDTKLRLLRVVASGQIEGIDVMWVNMLISNDEGRHVSIVFMTNADKMSELEGSDIQLADTFEFTRRLKSSEDVAQQEKSATTTK